MCPVPACKWSGSSRSRHAKSRRECGAQPVAIRYQPGTDVGGLVRMAQSDPKVFAAATMEIAERAEQGPAAPPAATATRVLSKGPPAARARAQPAGPPMEPPTKPPTLPTRTGGAVPPTASARQSVGSARAAGGDAEEQPEEKRAKKAAESMAELEAAAAAVDVAAVALEDTL